MNYYTTTQVANLLDKDEQSICRYIRIGRIKADKFRHEWLIPKSEYNRLKKLDDIDGRRKEP